MHIQIIYIYNNTDRTLQILASYQLNFTRYLHIIIIYVLFVYPTIRKQITLCLVGLVHFLKTFYNIT